MRSGGAYVRILPSRLMQGGTPCGYSSHCALGLVKADHIVFQALLHVAFNEQIM